MDHNEWNLVKDIVYRWVDKHPDTAINRSLALWLGVKSNFEVRR